MLNIRKQEENMLKKSLLLLLGILIVSVVCFAQEEPAEESMKDTTSAMAKESELSIEDLVMCAAIEDREPSGIGTVFSSDSEKIYCFTKIIGATDTTSVNHVWYMGDKEVSKVSLPVKASPWRTWSSKLVNMGLGKGMCGAMVF